MYLERQLGIRVGAADDFVAHFPIENSPCPYKTEGHPKDCPSHPH
jgi:hypothetical protein